MCTLKELSSGVNLWGNEWEEPDGLVLFRGKVYIPLDAQLWHDIIEAHHDTPVTGHSGQWKTTELVARNYWWPGMGCYIAKYVKGCDLCNRIKMFLTAPMGKLMPIRILYCRWQIISVDLITELPQSHGYDSILIAVDCLSKWAHFIATTSDITSLRVARLFQDGVWKLHRLPEEVISDRGPQFVSNFMRGLSEILGIKVAASTAYHLQTNGQTEHVNQEVEQFLCLFINQRQDDWYDWLSIAEFAYNDQVHTSTQTSLFMLNTGQNPRLGFEPIHETQLKSLDNFTFRMAQAMEEAWAALVKAADNMAQFYDAH